MAREAEPLACRKKEKKTEKGEYETDNNDERVKRRIQRGDDDES